MQWVNAFIFAHIALFDRSLLYFNFVLFDSLNLLNAIFNYFLFIRFNILDILFDATSIYLLILKLLLQWAVPWISKWIFSYFTFLTFILLRCHFDIYFFAMNLIVPRFINYHFFVFIFAWIVYWLQRADFVIIFFIDSILKIKRKRFIIFNIQFLNLTIKIFRNFFDIL